MTLFASSTASRGNSIEPNDILAFCWSTRRVDNPLNKQKDCRTASQYTITSQTYRKVTAGGDHSISHNTYTPQKTLTETCLYTLTAQNNFEFLRLLRVCEMALSFMTWWWFRQAYKIQRVYISITECQFWPVPVPSEFVYCIFHKHISPGIYNHISYSCPY